MKTAIPVFLLLILITTAIPRVDSSTQTFPPQTQTFVNALLTDYNSFVNLNWRDNQTGFASMEQFFSLYSPAGQTFKVIVAWAGPNDTSSLNMMFYPIGGNSPDIVYDYADYLASNLSPPNPLNSCTTTNQSASSTTSKTTTNGNTVQFTATVSICDFLQVGVNLTANYDYATNIAFDYNGTITNPILAIGVRAENVTGNYTAMAQDEAIYLYNSDVEYGKSRLATNSATQTTTQTQNSSVQQGAFGIPYPLIAAGGIIVLILGAIQLYFGSLRDFIVVVGSPEERGKVKQELKALRYKKKVKKEQEGKTQK